MLLALGDIASLRLELRRPNPQLLDDFRHPRGLQQLAAPLRFTGEIGGIRHPKYLRSGDMRARAGVHAAPNRLRIFFLQSLRGPAEFVIQGLYRTYMLRIAAWTLPPAL